MQNRNKNQRQQNQSSRGGFAEGFSEGWRGQGRGRTQRDEMQDSYDNGQGYRSRLNNDYANDEGYRSFQDMSDAGLRNDFNYDRSDDGGYSYGSDYGSGRSQTEWQRNERPARDAGRSSRDYSSRYNQDYSSRYENPERFSASREQEWAPHTSPRSQSSYLADRDSREYNDYRNIQHDRSYGSGYPRAGEFDQGRNATSSQYHGTRHDMSGTGRSSSETYGRGSQWGQGSEYGQSSTRGQFAGKGPKGFRRSDERIKEEVNEALEFDSEIDASEIEVAVKEGVCTLTGTISSRQMKRHAEACVENIRGVQDVKNELRVDTTLASQGTTSELSATEAGSRTTMNGNRNNLGRSTSSSTSSTTSTTKQ